MGGWCTCKCETDATPSPTTLSTTYATYQRTCVRTLGVVVAPKSAHAAAAATAKKARLRKRSVGICVVGEKRKEELFETTPFVPTTSDLGSVTGSRLHHNQKQNWERISTSTNCKRGDVEDVKT